MPLFKSRRNLGMLLLALWLVVTGLASLIGLSFAYMPQLLGGLAIAAGVLIALDR